MFNIVFIAYVVCIMHGINQGHQYQLTCVKGWGRSEIVFVIEIAL